MIVEGRLTQELFHAVHLATGKRDTGTNMWRRPPSKSLPLSRTLSRDSGSRVTKPREAERRDSAAQAGAGESLPRQTALTGLRLVTLS